MYVSECVCVCVSLNMTDKDVLFIWDASKQDVTSNDWLIHWLIFKTHQAVSGYFMPRG